jgi:four helix bundle protein
MSRDHRNLRVFQEADALVILAYHATAGLPAQERYGLQSQIRRAAISAATTIVEGCSRSTINDYCRFLDIAHASARECAYLFGLCVRLNFIAADRAAPMTARYEKLSAALLAAIRSLKRMDPGPATRDRDPEPEP